MTETTTAHHAADRAIATSVPVADFISQRWSPRAFDAQAEISDRQLDAGLEAARLAPSTSNTQPWRFIVGRRGGATFERILAHLIPFNQAWAAHASALIVNAAVTEVDGTSQPTALYDLGLAVQSLALQLHVDGFASHQISGIDGPGIDAEFALPEGVHAITVTVIGTVGDPAQLDERLAAREIAPRERQPLTTLVIARD